MRWIRAVALALSCCSWLCSFSLVSHAQPAAIGADKTLLEIDLVVPTGPGDPLISHRWRQEFEKIGEAVRIRQPLVGEKADVTERIRGTFRVVKITGMIDRNGNLDLPGRKFQIGQSAELKKWLSEFQTYGAQGSPTGQPQWGLTDTQYRDLRASLTPAVADAVRGQPLATALKLLAIPASLPITEHSTIETAWRTAQTSPVEDEVQGLSSGTALAAILAQHGWGFRPVRTPSGQIQLLVESLAEITDPWPVGYTIDDARPRNEIIPELFKNVETGVRDSSLSSVLDAVEDRTGVRLLVDEFQCQKKELNPREVLVSYPSKYTAWALILRHVIVNAHMSMNYRQDEAGKGFIWITPSPNYVRPVATPPKASRQ